MTNKDKAKILKEKIIKIASLSDDYEKGRITPSNYESFLKSEIQSIKEETINNFRNDIEKDIKELVLLKRIKIKLQNNLDFTNEENEYFLLHL